MITAYLQGGLGNQMFQMAAAYNLSIKMGVETGFCSELHNLPLQGKPIDRYKDNVFSRIKFIEKQTFYSNKNLYKEKKFSYDEIVAPNNTILLGYFQSHKYFKENEEKVKELFSETDEIKKHLDQKYKHIRFEEATSLHVRRGDYLNLQHVHPVCTKQYYDNALKTLGKEIENILIFSDDIEWCKQNLKYDNCEFISDEDYNELYLMSRCKNNIIANSSFSWWGAWLNNDVNKKVICPMKWFGPKGHKDTQDIYPKKWKKV